MAQTLGQEWEQAALQLGLKTKDLDDIKAEHRSVAMQKLKMLVLWKRRRPPGEATAQDLLEGLKDVEDLPDNTPLSLSGNVLHPHTHTQAGGRHSGVFGSYRIAPACYTIAGYGYSQIDP